MSRRQREPCGCATCLPPVDSLAGPLWRQTFDGPVRADRLSMARSAAWSVVSCRHAVIAGLAMVRHIHAGHGSATDRALSPVGAMVESRAVERSGRLGTRGRGAGPGGRAPHQRRDREPLVHLGPDGREPRLVTAEEARRDRPPRARRRGRHRSRPATLDLAAGGRGPVAAVAADVVRGPGGRTSRARRGPGRSPAGHGGRPRRCGKDPARAGGGDRRHRPVRRTGRGTSTWCR